MTMSWGITPGLTANLAVNPDFSQVEADVAQLDVNNQFSLFYPGDAAVLPRGSRLLRDAGQRGLHTDRRRPRPRRAAHGPQPDGYLRRVSGR